MEHLHTYEQTVVWRDLDALAHVNNAVYATYLENARLAFFTALAAEAGEELPLILAELTISYKSQAHLGEQLVIQSRIAEIRNTSFIMEAVITEKSSGRLVATSRAVLVHFDYTAQCSVTIPEAWRERLSRGPTVKATT
jgi:acyl-CoA thioester hydrolase